MNKQKKEMGFTIFFICTNIWLATTLIIGGLNGYSSEFAKQIFLACAVLLTLLWMAVTIVFSLD